MATPTRKCGSLFNSLLLVFYENHNKKCLLKKLEQLSSCVFAKISSQPG